MSLKYISLFSGICGFEVGIDGIFSKAKCMGFSEIDLDAINIYVNNFPNHEYLRDIKNIDGTRFRNKIDLLVGGSPCQNFSTIAHDFIYEKKI
jgi:DNA (cytosine-5)-methyltransferase 1